MFGVPWKPRPCLLTLTLLVTVPLCRNVNGLRAVLKKGLPEYVKADKPDVLCLTETKIDDSVTASVRGCLAACGATLPSPLLLRSHDVPPAQLSKSLPGYAAHWCCCTGKKGYSGSAIFCRDGVAPLSITRGVGIAEHDAEGRVITAEFDKFFLVCTYVPNSGAALDRLEYRTTAWDAAMLAFLKGLEAKGKPVVRGREPCRRHVACLRRHVVCAWLSRRRCGRVTSTSHTRTWTSTTPRPTYAHVLFSLCACVCGDALFVLCCAAQQVGRLLRQRA